MSHSARRREQTLRRRRAKSYNNKAAFEATVEQSPAEKTRRRHRRHVNFTQFAPPVLQSRRYSKRKKGALWTLSTPHRRFSAAGREVPPPSLHRRYLPSSSRNTYLLADGLQDLALDSKPGCILFEMGVAILLLICTITLIFIRITYVVYHTGKPRSGKPPPPLSTLIVLGSGGHTAEMINLLNPMQMERFKPRYYVAAATDSMSLQKARVLEDSLMDKTKDSHFMQIYRSREVGQSYVTSVGTTLIALTHALWLMIKIRPQVILCNGPGTCIPLCVIAFIFKVLGVRWSSIFYVESIARVRRLSLSGLLLYKLHMADQLFVQWPQLKSKYPRANYLGRLMVRQVAILGLYWTQDEMEAANYRI
ncbi:UDP-N-acetylglucosamine transferase subunit ALG 14 [Striga asiatica]|uniref:UDP-N-acetylglucosamine transferase subunit ALG14 n=1 Tax=Striga asiatica TaxID=4170 RepID=A0A5A7QCR8_STRAF|nr:UDP-N-acetylglucosamine transferase subunit ALG 14 [Striga asiatica]